MSEQASGEQAAPEQTEQPPERATTSFTKDFLGRDLVTPQVNSRDYLGRATLSTIDYLNRHLLP